MIYTFPVYFPPLKTLFSSPLQHLLINSSTFEVSSDLSCCHNNCWKIMSEGWWVMEGVPFFGHTIGWAELPYGFSSLAFLIWLLIIG